MSLKRTENKLNKATWRRATSSLKRHKRQRGQRENGFRGDQVGPETLKSYNYLYGRPYERLRKRQTDFTKDD